MREVQVSEITKLVKEHCIRANKILPCDVECRMREACKTESSPLGKEILKDLVTNFEEAKNIDVPICQDTGMAWPKDMWKDCCAAQWSATRSAG